MNPNNNWQDNISDMGDLKTIISLLITLIPGMTSKTCARILGTYDMALDNLLSRDSEDLMGDPDRDLTAHIPDLARNIPNITQTREQLKTLLQILDAVEDEQLMLLKLRHLQRVHTECFEDVKHAMAITEHEAVPGTTPFMTNLLRYNNPYQANATPVAVPPIPGVTMPPIPHVPTPPAPVMPVTSPYPGYPGEPNTQNGDDSDVQT